MILKCPLFLLLLSIPLNQGANILAIMPTPSYSHQIAYLHIWKELSLRGHKVVLITTDPLANPNFTNLTEIDMHWTYDIMNKFGATVEKEITMWTVNWLAYPMFRGIAEAQLSHTEVQNLIHGTNNFDVVLVEFLYPEFLAFAEIYKCPKILIASFDVKAINHYLIGNPINPILYPDMGIEFYGKYSFRERVSSTLLTLYNLYLYMYPIFSGRTELVTKYFNISRSVYELLSDVDMMFVNVNPLLHPIRALGPSTIAIGDGRPTAPTQNLTKELAEFLDGASDGFIYFSLGNIVKSKDLNQDTLESITQALRDVPYKVLWKFEGDGLHNKPENVKLIKWAPQRAVLSHPNIRLFITQGGLQSIEDAIHLEVPLVVIPFFADQYQNARIIESKGLAVVVGRTPSVKTAELKAAVLEVTHNSKYKQAVKRLRQLILDTPMTGTEKAVWWTEYVIRNKGAKHLRNPAADIFYYSTNTTS